MKDGDGFKGSVHAVTGGLAATMCLYNALEWSRRHELRLACNMTIYGALWAFEGYQAWRHWSGDVR